MRADRNIQSAVRSFLMGANDRERDMIVGTFMGMENELLENFGRVELRNPNHPYFGNYRTPEARKYLEQQFKRMQDEILMDRNGWENWIMQAVAEQEMTNDPNSAKIKYARHYGRIMLGFGSVLVAGLWSAEEKAFHKLKMMGEDRTKGPSEQDDTRILEKLEGTKA